MTPTRHGHPTSARWRSSRGAPVASPCSVKDRGQWKRGAACPVRRTRGGGPVDARWPIRHLPHHRQGGLCDATQRRPHAASARGHAVHRRRGARLAGRAMGRVQHRRVGALGGIHRRISDLHVRNGRFPAAAACSRNGARDSRELFYLGPDGSMMSVRVDARAELTAARRRVLFATKIAADPTARSPP